MPPSPARLKHLSERRHPGDRAELGHRAQLSARNRQLPGQNGVKLDLLGSVATEGSGSIGLTSYTVLRYPAN